MLGITARSISSGLSVRYSWASPHEKSEEKGQCQNVKFVCLKMKENNATRHKSTFWASLFLRFGTFLAVLGLGQNMPIILEPDFRNRFNHFKN